MPFRFGDVRRRDLFDAALGVGGFRAERVG